MRAFHILVENGMCVCLAFGDSCPPQPGCSRASRGDDLKLLVMFQTSFSLLLSPQRSVTRSSRRSCCGSGWTAAWPRGGSWWPCRRARAAATTPWSPRWWRSGWIATGRSGPARPFPTARKTRMTTTSDGECTESEAARSVRAGVRLVLQQLVVERPNSRRERAVKDLFWLAWREF